MRFGLFVPQGWRLDLVGIDTKDHWQTMLGIAQEADREDGPFESIWVFDHFHTVPWPTQEATHEAWTLMAAFGAATSRVRLGQMCTCMGYRNPAYLAKVAATVDVISQGRAEMGIGAGWYEHEWRAYGYGFPKAGDRIGMLDEGVQIMRQLWTTGNATLDGKHYQVDGAICQPLPLQDGGVPLWIAGGGEKKTLRIAAQYADYTNFDGSPEGFSRKSEILRQHCQDVGTDFDQITRSANYNVILGETDKDVQDRIAWMKDHLLRAGVPQEIAENRVNEFANGMLVGTPEVIAERLAEVGKLGMTYAILNFAEVAYDRTSLTLFTEKIAPQLTA
ncbi:MAG TPA: LLM class F420-dependent oxidoreductase [Trebonia sp.]|nr:LLM class F420-dependent oxidoreductase [Trebonia sp.]